MKIRPILEAFILDMTRAGNMSRTTAECYRGRDGSEWLVREYSADSESRLKIADKARELLDEITGWMDGERASG